MSYVFSPKPLHNVTLWEAMVINGFLVGTRVKHDFRLQASYLIGIGIMALHLIQLKYHSALDLTCF